MGLAGAVSAGEDVGQKRASRQVVEAVSGLIESTKLMDVAWLPTRPRNCPATVAQSKCVNLVVIGSTADEARRSASEVVRAVQRLHAAQHPDLTGVAVSVTPIRPNGKCSDRQQPTPRSVGACYRQLGATLVTPLPP
jgi:hypothetical protein